jgi:peptide/nickel transport system substrate-binding protein
MTSSRISVGHKLGQLFVLAILMLSACAGPAGPEASPGTGGTAAPQSTPGTEVTQATGGQSELSADRLVPEITFVFSSATHDPIRHESGLLLTEEWEKLGLRVSTQPLDFSAYVAILQSGEGFNAFIAGYVSRGEYLDPDILLYRPFHSSGIDTGINYFGYNNPEYDALVEEQRTEMDIEARKQLVYEAQATLAEDLPMIALYHVKDIHAYNSRLFNNVTPMMGQGLWNFWNILSITPIAEERVLRQGQVLAFETANPFADSNEGNTETFRLVFDMLARIKTDGTPTPWAAESWNVVDPTTVEVKLREDMAFHDGVPVTARDVKFSYDVQKEQGSSVYRPFLEIIESVEVVDDYNLVFHLTQPYPALFQTTFAMTFILPEHIWSEIPDPKSQHVVEDLVGSGPFIWNQWIPGEEIRLDANKDYFQAPEVDGMTQVFFANPDAIFLGLVNETIHMHDRRLLPAQIQQLESQPHLTRVDRDDFGVYYLGFNMRVPPFDNPVLREAVAYTVDYDTIVNTLLAGFAIPGKGIIAPANTFWHNPDQRTREYDPERGRQILAEAGFEWDDQGRLYYPAP